MYKYAESDLRDPGQGLIGQLNSNKNKLYIYVYVYMLINNASIIIYTHIYIHILSTYIRQSTM